MHRNLSAIARAKRDAELSKIEVTPVPNMTMLRKWNVTRGGALIGFIEQYTARTGETHPYKALPLAWNRQAVMAGSFYGKNGMKNATDAVSNYLK